MQQEQQQQQGNAGNQDEDAEDDEASTGRLIGACKAKFQSSENDMCLLMTIAYGLKNNQGRMIADWEGEPYLSDHKINRWTFKLNLAQLWDEIKACVDALGVPKPKIKSAGMELKMKCLA